MPELTVNNPWLDLAAPDRTNGRPGKILPMVCSLALHGLAVLALVVLSQLQLFSPAPPVQQGQENGLYLSLHSLNTPGNTPSGQSEPEPAKTALTSVPPNNTPKARPQNTPQPLQTTQTKEAKAPVLTRVNKKAAPSAQSPGRTGTSLAISSGQTNRTSTFGRSAGASGQAGQVWQAAHVPKPKYPPLSRQRHEQGNVLVTVEVLPSGQTGQVRLASSSGHERLDRAALNAAAQVVFTAAGRPPESRILVNIPYQFRLTDQ